MGIGIWRRNLDGELDMFESAYDFTAAAQKKDQRPPTRREMLGADTKPRGPRNTPWGIAAADEGHQPRAVGGGLSDDLQPRLVKEDG